MDIADKVYNFMKSSNDKDGFVPTVSQIAEELNIADHEANAAIERLKESGRIKITDIPRKTTIEFADELLRANPFNFGLTLFYRRNTAFI